MQMNDRGLYDIYGIDYVPFWQTNSFFWGILIFVIVFVCGIGILFLKYWLRRKAQMTPWQVALEQLNALVVTEALSPVEAKRYYFVLTNSMKTYMVLRYQWNVMHLTDQECIDFITKSSLDSAFKQPLCRLFDDATLIKFADQKAAALLLKNHIDAMRALIHATIPHKKQHDKQ